MTTEQLFKFLVANSLEASYIIASVTFIIGLKRLSHPEKARSGNLIAAFGMGLAIFATLLFKEELEPEKVLNYSLIIGGMIIGTIIGATMAYRVKMTAMPQMVSFFNGMGGACAAVISIVEFNHMAHAGTGNLKLGLALTIALGLVIGTVSFAGSIIAFGKLEEKIKDKALPGGQYINLGLLASIIAVTLYLVTRDEAEPMILYVILGLSILYGVLFVMPIGGADMPVVISLLNSFTGVAAAFGGFLYNNQAMLTGGILVGSAGTILTVLMCQAMNRSLRNVIIGSFGGGDAGPVAKAGDQGPVKEISLTDAAILCNYANRVCIIPGYGLAVAQAQHLCHNLESILTARGVEVFYGIHPVAGRMPGHMNVLLAEADVSYEKLIEMEDANPKLNSTDVVLVIGANDVVNPAAIEDASSPIFGMPILDVRKAKNVIVFKRGMSFGYAGIQNALFFTPNTRMLFGDAKASLEKLVAEIKTL
jgi:NAD(P) transhydrogenase subunit beta